MNNLSFTACSIWLRTKNLNKRNNIEIVNLNKTIKGKEKNYSDFFDIMLDFCKEYNNFVINRYEQKMFKIDTKDIKIEETKKLRYIYLEVNSGGDGIQADIINPETKGVVYTRKREYAETIKFKVYIAIPKGDNVYKGIIMFQNIGQFGIKTITTDYIKAFIEEKLKLMTVVGSICPEIYVDKLLKYEELKKIVYTRNIVSNDKSDTDQIGYGKEERTLTNFVNMNGWKERISAYMNSNDMVYEFENQKYNVVKLITSANGKQRTININNLENLSIIEGIPDSVRNSNGDIEDEKMKKYFTEMAEEYLERMVYNQKQTSHD